MPRSPQWMDLYQIWFRGSPRGHNQSCRILLQSAHGFRFCEGSKFAISRWLGWSPLTQCWRYRAACDSTTLGLAVSSSSSESHACFTRASEPLTDHANSNSNGLNPKVSTGTSRYTNSTQGKAESQLSVKRSDSARNIFFKVAWKRSIAPWDCGCKMLLLIWC